jgi:SAM-dependent methyltransferase
VVAVDWLADASDGLGACRHYPVPFTAVQADFDALPFEPAQFDLAVFAGSLHYAPDPAATVAEAARVLAPGGVIAVLDSPTFERDADGEAMVASQLRSLAAAHALERAMRAGRGFLTFSSVERACEAVGRRVRFYKTRGPLAWRARRAVARLRLGRAPAAFGLWVAR